MSTEAPRYAVYFAPEAGSALSRFGTGIIGYDAWTGRDVPFDPPVLGEVNSVLNADWHPRRYGFHATLKAPIVLRDPSGEGALLDFAARYAAGARAVRLDGLALEWLGTNFALRPEGDVTALDALAFEIVRAFDPFRAPLTEAERARRLAGKLTPRQIENLDRWGYHYVDEDFWFHMTLTGPIAPERQSDIAGALEDAYRIVPVRPVLIDNVTIFRQDSRSMPFRILQRFPFAG
ncbi:MAG: DUF1045 domain-containing protein [Beijerinckiaceae bacterium]|nr:DUF1045 domain-containing protein [Beijerinckiaceae bacterium]